MPFVVALLVITATGVCDRTAGADPDSVRVRVEVGWRTDASNETYYEQTFDDTTFRPARLQSTPEVVHSAVGRLDWGELADGRRDAWRLGLEGRAGDLVRSLGLDGRLRRVDLGGWEIVVTPRAAWQSDRTFDRDRSELRTSAAVQAWRGLAGSMSRWGLTGGSEVLRSSGAGSEFVLDRNVLSMGAAFERSSWSGGDLRLDYGLDARQFPDSTSRDHLEHHAEASARLDAGSGSVDANIRVNRRGTMQSAATTRDRYWSGDASSEWRLGAGAAWSGVARIEGEWQRYDRPDSEVYFDYGLVRAQAGPRLESGGWSLEAAPRVEWLLAPSNAGESYVEPALGFEAEWVGSGALWALAPAFGRREYDSEEAGAVELHQSFTFLEAHLVADQALPGRMRLRTFLYGRLEQHADSTQNTRSLYFSVDVRRLF